MKYLFGTLWRRFKVVLCFEPDSASRDEVDSGDYEPEYVVPPERVKKTWLLPESVLRRIFIYASYGPISSSISPYIDAHPSHGPLLVAQICSRWRKTALGTPSLWSAMNIGNRHCPDTVALWLGRSGAEPLFLRLNGIHDHDQLAKANSPLLLHPFERHPALNDRPVLRCLRLLATHIHRWKNISFVLDVQSAYAFLDLPLGDIRPKQALILEEVAMQMIVRDSHVMSDRVLQFLQRSVACIPSFKRLKWDSARPPAVECDVVRRPIWAQLNMVHMQTGMSVHESAFFLSQCQSATEVAVDCIFHTGCTWIGWQYPLIALNQRPTSKTILPNLTKLSLGFGAVGRDCTAVLEYFTLPSLRFLDIQNFGTSDKSCDILEDFFMRSFPNIRASSESARTSVPPFQHFLLRDDSMAGPVLFRCICMSVSILRHIPSVNLYTRRPLQWQYDLETLQILYPGVTDTLHYREDSTQGKWVGWGTLPGSSLF